MKEYVYKQKFKRKWWYLVLSVLKSLFRCWYMWIPSIYLILFTYEMEKHRVLIPESVVRDDNLISTICYAGAIAGIACVMIAFLFWNMAGIIADILTPKILAWIRRRKKSTGKDLNRCPMLECEDDGCVYFDKEHNVCKHAEVTDDV